MKRTPAVIMAMTLTALLGLGGCETMPAPIIEPIKDALKEWTPNKSKFDNPSKDPVVDLITKAILFSIEQQQVATKGELEEAYREEGIEVPQGQSVGFLEFEVKPQHVTRDVSPKCSGNYDVFGSVQNPETDRYGVMRVYNADSGASLLQPAQFPLGEEGRHIFQTEIDIPDDAVAGEYIIEVRLVNGSADAVVSSRITIV